MLSSDDTKRAVARAAVDRYVRAGTCIGLGTGTTAKWAVARVGERIAAGEAIVAVATSRQTERLCAEAGVPLVGLGERPIDVALDGADEVAPDWSLTKGGGGALFREKAVALEAARFVVVVTPDKLVPHLGAFPTPVEVVPFTLRVAARALEEAFPQATVRVRGGETPFVTDNGNHILDCAFGAIEDAAELDHRIRAVHGVLDSGLFVGLAHAVLVGEPDGNVRELIAPPR
ncbi:MAG: ribose 5-phosphate isomerase [Candidatus Eremiobacteraeota bacterium]|jgi:ribose 5-phosphate isomerase A|nr:ribose 5-phosphate isomerase [Candidatus Eremiobacteraeota bacterium]